MASRLPRAVQNHRIANPQGRRISHAKLLIRESREPGRECHYAKCSLCQAIVHSEWPLTGAPRTSAFESMAQRALDKHECA